MVTGLINEFHTTEDLSSISNIEYLTKPRSSLAFDFTIPEVCLYKYILFINATLLLSPIDYYVENKGRHFCSNGVYYRGHTVCMYNVLMYIHFV